MLGVAATARAGTNVIVDEVFLGGAASQARSQAAVVHEGIVYDLELDTTHTEAMACAEALAAYLARA
jgi:chloramphenicol 3-O phosphotransferase